MVHAPVLVLPSEFVALSQFLFVVEVCGVAFLQRNRSAIDMCDVNVWVRTHKLETKKTPSREMRDGVSRTTENRCAIG
jgi:hypothetical protein